MASTARAQEPEVMEVSKDKARLAASLFGDGSSPSQARPAGRRTPQKQVQLDFAGAYWFMKVNCKLNLHARSSKATCAFLISLLRCQSMCVAELGVLPACRQQGTTGAMHQHQMSPVCWSLMQTRHQTQSLLLHLQPPHPSKVIPCYTVKLSQHLPYQTL